MTEYSPGETGEYPRIFPNFQKCARCEKDLKENKDNSLHLGRKYARIFVLGHYLFLIACSFPRALLSENCLLLGTDIWTDIWTDICRQISEQYFHAKWWLLFKYILSAYEVKNNLWLFESPFKIQKNGVFLFEISFFVLEISTFFYYANLISDDVILCATKMWKTLNKRYLWKYWSSVL